MVYSPYIPLLLTEMIFTYVLHWMGLMAGQARFTPCLQLTGTWLLLPIEHNDSHPLQELIKADKSLVRNPPSPLGLILSLLVPAQFIIRRSYDTYTSSNAR